MKKLLLTLSLIIATASVAYAEVKKPEGVIHDLKIIRIIDGDTVEIEAPFLIDPLPKKLSIRVWGVDTPEKGGRASCEKEAELGAAASKFTKDLVANAKTTQINLYQWDKFGGRVLGDVLIDGQSLTKMLIEKGYAREYYGDAKKSWCE
jgi:endonuclease YncB( thermonuclease family)